MSEQVAEPSTFNEQTTDDIPETAIGDKDKAFEMAAVEDPYQTMLQNARKAQAEGTPGLESVIATLEQGKEDTTGAVAESYDKEKQELENRKQQVVKDVLSVLSGGERKVLFDSKENSRDKQFEKARPEKDRFVYGAEEIESTAFALLGITKESNPSYIGKNPDYSTNRYVFRYETGDGLVMDYTVDSSVYVLRNESGGISNERMRKSGLDPESAVDLVKYVSSDEEVLTRQLVLSRQ